MNSVTRTGRSWPSPDSRSAALFRRAEAVLPGGSTRSTVFTAPFPPYAVSASGAYVVDADGKRLLDVANNYTSLIHGHCHPAITDRIVRQASRLGAVALPTELEIELAEIICDRLPGAERTRFVNSGTEAVMTTLRAARAATGRHRIAKCEGAYHGSYDYAAISLRPAPSEWGTSLPRSVPDAPGVPPSVLEDVVVLPFNDIEKCRTILSQYRGELACVLVDALPNRAGLMPADSIWLEMLRDWTQEDGSFLVFDEVISFRLGVGGAQGITGITPDLTVLGKIIGGGLPVGAIAGSSDAMSVFDQRSTPYFANGGTFNANPLTMAAGIAAMELLTPQAFSALDEAGARVRAAINSSYKRHGVIGQVTGAGSLMRMHFVSGQISDYRSSRPDAHAMRGLDQVYRTLLIEGVLGTASGLVSLSTVMENADLEFLESAMDRAIASVGKNIPELRRN